MWDITFRPYTGSVTGYVLETGGPVPAFITEAAPGLGATGADRGTFSYHGYAGQSLQVQVQLLALNGGPITDRDPVITVHAPDGSALTPTDSTIINGLLTVNYRGANPLPQTGDYTIQVEPESGGDAPFSASTSDETDLQGATKVRFTQNNFEIPPDVYIPVQVQVYDDDGPLDVAGIPVVFYTSAWEHVYFTDGNGRAGMNIKSTYPGSYVSVSAQLPNLWSSADRCEMYTQDLVPDEGQEHTNQLERLELKIPNRYIPAGQTATITIKAYNNVNDPAPDGSTVTVTVGDSTPAVILPEHVKSKLITVNGGEASVEILVGEVIDCEGCAVRYLTLQEADEYSTIVGYNSVEVTAHLEDGKTVSDETHPYTVPGPAAEIRFEPDGFIWPESGVAGMLLCATTGYPYVQMSARVSDEYDNAVANAPVEFTSNYGNLLYEYTKGPSGGLPHFNDDLPFSNTYSTKTYPGGNALVLWLLKNQVEPVFENRLDARARDGGGAELAATPLRIVSAPAAKPYYASGLDTVYYHWLASHPEAHQYYPMPEAIGFRIFKRESDGLTAPTAPADHVAVKFTDSSGVGWVATDPAVMFEEGEAADPVLGLTVDDFGYAEVYWAPGRHAGTEPPMGYLNVAVEAPDDQNFGWGSLGTFLGDPEMSAEVVALDGATRPLDDGGLALTAEKELVLKVKNPADFPLWIKVENEHFGSDGEVLDFASCPYAVKDPAPDGGWFLKVPPYYDAPVSDRTHVFHLPLNDNSDGAHDTFTLLYSTSLKDDYSPGLPASDAKAVTLKQFEFSVAAVRLITVDVMGDNWLGEWGEIDLWNGIGGWEIPEPEWIRGIRDVPPSHGPYHDYITSPTAVVRGERIKMKVAYFCLGLDSIDITASCEAEGSAAPDVCPYGDLGPATLAPCWNQDNPINSTNAIFFTTLTSDASPATALASINDYQWRVHSYQREGEFYFLDPPPIIEDTHHRIYSLYDSPKDYAIWGPGSSDEGPWLETLELSYSILRWCNPSEPIDDLKIMSCITKGVYNSSWVNDEKTFFINDPLPIKYNSNPWLGPHRYLLGQIIGFAIPSFDFNLFLKDIQNIPYNSEVNFVNADCYTYNLFNGILIKTQGVGIKYQQVLPEPELNWKWPPINASKLYTKELRWSSPSGEEIFPDEFDSHFVVVYKPGVDTLYDATNMNFVGGDSSTPMYTIDVHTFNYRVWIFTNMSYYFDMGLYYIH